MSRSQAAVKCRELEETEDKLRREMETRGLS